MTYGISSLIWALPLVSVSQLLPCGGSATQDYERFSSHVAKQDCKAIYQDLDANSRTRLDAMLETIVALALAAHDQAAQAQVSKKPHRTRGTSVEPDASAAAADAPDAGVQDDPDDSPPTQTTNQGVTIESLRKLKEQALFVALCTADFPALPTLYRERGLDQFVPLKVSREEVRDDHAELSVQKAKKGEQSSSVKLVKEGDHFQVELTPISITWRPMDDGRLVPVFECPLLSVGVEVNGSKTATAAYDAMVAHLQNGQCEEFYNGLDSVSRSQIQRALPMMIGFAHAIGEQPSLQGADQDRGKGMLISMCKKASDDSGTMSGLHLGSVIEEQINDNHATLIVRDEHDATKRHTVLMVREAGQWRLSIDAFSAPAQQESQKDVEAQGDNE